jgi:hypothetical protein
MPCDRDSHIIYRSRTCICQGKVMHYTIPLIERASISICLDRGRYQSWCLESDRDTRISSDCSLDTLSDCSDCRDRGTRRDCRESCDSIDDRTRGSDRDRYTLYFEISCTICTASSYRSVGRSRRYRLHRKSCKSCWDIECDRNSCKWSAPRIGQCDRILEGITDL